MNLNLSDLEAAFILHRQQALEKTTDPRVYIEHPFALAKRLSGYREIGQSMQNVVFKRDRMVIA
jgi:hypothetical protein